MSATDPSPQRGRARAAIGSLALFLLIALGIGGLAATFWSEPEVPTRQGNPPLWHVIAPDGGEGWILGSIHLLPADVRWITPALKNAEARAGMLLVEAADANDPAATRSFTRLAAAPSPLPVADRLPPELRGAGAVTIAQAGASSPALAHMDSWAVALSLASAQSAGAGLSSERGVETILTRRFRAAGKPIAGLESAEKQFTLFDTLAEADQRALLVAVIRGAATSKADYDRNLSAWLRGDLDALMAGAGDGVLATPGLREALLDGRNRAWVDQVAQRIVAGEKPLVTVGAGHVAGATGLPALLAARGYKVTRLH